MAKQVPWNKLIAERFIELAMLTKEEEWVLRTRIAGKSIVEQSMELGMSTSSINRIVSRLKRKYDAVEKYDPMLPPRKYSAEETWMDQN